MKAISVKQPWAWALFHGKPVENRVWPTNFRGELLIHASKNFDEEGVEWIRNNFPELNLAGKVLRLGCIIGKVTMTDCVVSHPSPWFAGPYGFVFKDPIEFKKPIPFKGALKFFDVPDELIKEFI